MPWRQNVGQMAEFFTLPRVYLKDDHIEGLTSGKIVPSDAAPTIPGISKDAIYPYALDCIWAVLDGGDGVTLPAAIFPIALKAAGFKDGISLTLCSVFWAVWADIEGPFRDTFCHEHRDDIHVTTLEGEEADKIIETVRACRDARLVTDADLMGTLDLRLLHQVGVGVGVKQFANKLNNMANMRAKKVMHYNSFREEPEGFAKLLTLLNNAALHKLSDLSLINSELTQLIGYFALSPMKVVYCIVCAIEDNPESSQALLSLDPMKDGRWCSECIALRVRYPSARQPVPPPHASFYEMLVTLIHNDRFQLSHLLALLAESISKLADSFQAHLLDDAAADAELSEPRGHEPSAQHFHFSLDKRDEILSSKIGFPAPVQLLLALLKRTPWADVKVLWQYLQQCCGHQLLAHRSIGIALMRYIDEALEGPLKLILPDGGLGACLLDQDDLANVPLAEPLASETVELLVELGSFLFRRPNTLVALWRVLLHILLTHREANDRAQQDALRVMCCSALPASSFLVPNPGVWHLVAQCLSQLSQLQRLELFAGAVEVMPIQAGALREPLDLGATLTSRLLGEHQRLVHQALQLLQKKMQLAAAEGDNQEDLFLAQCKFAKVFTTSPLGAAMKIVASAKFHDNIGAKFISLAGTLETALQELLILEAVRNLAVTHGRLAPDGYNPAEWHAHIGVFISSCIARFEQVEFAGVFRFVMTRLQGHALQGHAPRRAKDTLIDTYILENIFRVAFGELVIELDRDKWSTLFLGPVARAHKNRIEEKSHAQIIIRRKKRFLGELLGVGAGSGTENLLIPLYLLLCRQQVMLAQNMDRTDNVPQTLDMIERTQLLIFRVLDLLHQLAPTELEAIVPPIDQMCYTHRLRPEHALPLLRPVIRQALQHWSLPAEEPEEGQAAEEPAEVAVGTVGQPNDTARTGSSDLLEAFVQQVYRAVPGLRPAEGQMPLIDPRFYLLFWALDAPDLCPQTDAFYTEVKTEIKQQVDQARKNIPKMHGNFGSAPGQRPTSKAELQSAQTAIMDLQQRLDDAEAERQVYVARASKWRAFIASRASQIFRSHARASATAAAHLLMQECILPRCVLSMEDAVYSAHLLFMLADMATPNFGFAHSVDRVCLELVSQARCATRREATNVAIFLNETLCLPAYEQPEQTNRCCIQLLRLISIHNDEDWLQRAKILAKGSPISKAQWDKLLHKHQKRMAETLESYLQMDGKFDKRVMANALSMVLNMVPEFPKTEEAFSMVSRVVKGMRKSIEHVPELLDIKHLRDAAERELGKLSGTFNQASAGSDNDTSTAAGGGVEDGEVDEHRDVPQKRGRGDVIDGYGEQPLQQRPRSAYGRSVPAFDRGHAPYIMERRR